MDELELMAEKIAAAQRLYELAGENAYDWIDVVIQCQNIIQDMKTLPPPPEE